MVVMAMDKPEEATHKKEISACFTVHCFTAPTLVITLLIDRNDV